MQAGRELDVKVAEALGWGVEEMEGNGYTVPDFSTTWEGMGVLVEEARKKDLYLEYSHAMIGGYFGAACVFVEGEYQTTHMTDQAVPTAPHAVCLVFLIARGGAS